MEFNKETLAKLFAAVNTASLDSETRDAYELLKTLCTSNFAADQTDGKCVDLYNLNLYKSVLLWEGKEDVKCVLDSGVFDEYLQGLDDDQYDAFVDAITDAIDWDGESFCGGTTGNEVISSEIEKYLTKNGFIPSEGCHYPCTEYAVEVQDRDTMDFIRQIDVFATYDEASDYIEKHPECADNECLNIMYVEYDENGNEIAAGLAS